MITNRLFNATPFKIRMPYDKGVLIKIDPDGSYDLTNAQMVDFTPGQPGSEAVQMLMNDYGMFLRDTDRTFESQSLETLRACRRSKNAHYEEATNNLRRSRAQAGIVDNPEALEETFRQLGLTGTPEQPGLREQVKRLDFRIKQLEGVVSSQGAVAKQNAIDPERTLLFTDPVKVFETKFHLQMFLSEPENAKLKVQYDAWIKANAKQEA